MDQAQTANPPQDGTERPFPLPRRAVRRNHRLGVLNGVFIELGMGLTNPGMVLTVLVRELGGSNALVGLLPALRFGGWFLPQFIVGGWVQSRPKRIPIIVAIDAIRIVLYGVICGAMFAFGSRSPAVALALLLVLFTITRFSAGSGAVPRLDLYAGFVPRERRASFIAHKSFFGGLAAFSAGLIVQAILSARWIGFASNYGLLFGGSTLCLLAATAVLGAAQEPPAAGRQQQRSLAQQMRYGRTLLREDHRYRRYVIVRLTLSMIRIGSPFYVVYALDRLDAPTSIAGTYLAMITFTRILSNPLWSRVLQRRGLKFVFQASTALLAASAFLAVIVPALIEAVHLPDQFAAVTFGAVLLVQGLALGGHNVSNLPALYEIAPASERATYIGLLNTIMGPTSFVSTISGSLIDVIGYEPIFLTAGALVAVAFAIGTGLQLPDTLRRRSGTPQAQPRAQTGNAQDREEAPLNER
jgi:MFS family permease